MTMKTLEMVGNWELMGVILREYGYECEIYNSHKVPIKINHVSIQHKPKNLKSVVNKCIISCTKEWHKGN